MPMMNVQLEWKEDLGPAWMNLDNLKALLFTDQKTNESLLEVIPLDSPPDEQRAKWRHVAARLWCDDEMAGEVLDARLCEAIAILLENEYEYRPTVSA